MSYALDAGPHSTAVEGVTSIGVTSTMPVNWDEDFRLVSKTESGATYINVGCALNTPELITIESRERANIYGGSAIESAAQLSNKRGIDFRIEVRQVRSLIDTDGSLPELQAPTRVQITGTWPMGHSEFGRTDLVDLLGRAVAAFAEQGDADILNGTGLLLHGVTER